MLGVMTDRLGERLLLENDRVRVWEDRVAPGESQPVHTHRNPYLSVVVTPVRAEIVDADGAVLYDVDRQPGEVRWFEEVPVTHSLRNTGDADAVVVVVELLGGS
jgi:hypothetical protein